MNRMTLCLLVLLLAMPGLAFGQTIRASAGEHADFTRIVLRVPNGIGWRLTESGTSAVIVPSAPSTFDLTGLFDRIPRRRLSSAVSDAGGLTLELACDCPLRAWEERPGLVVIDILNSGMADPAVPATPPGPEASAPAPAQVNPSAVAQRAGADLARARRDRAESEETAASGLDAAAIEQLTDDLGRRFAQAFGQGLLEARGVRGAPGVLLPTAELDSALPQNMRLVDATQRMGSPSVPEIPPDLHCQGAEALDFLLAPQDSGFLEGLSAHGQALYGEFDQSSDEGFLRLMRHYLAAGFGAEARTLIRNLRDPLPGRDLLLGFSDLLEGRMSNSRMRLAEATGCDGPAGLAAMLANPTERISPDRAASLALTFTRLPPPLRAVLAVDVVGHLLQAQAPDSARVAAESLRSPLPATAELMGVVDAMLDAFRGDSVRATGHLDPIAGRDTAGTIAWLDLAWRNQTRVAEGALDDAEALAAQLRGTEEGVLIMESVIRLRSLSPRPERALVTLDRLESWGRARALLAATITTLRDETWSAIARSAEDRTVISLTLARSDWLDPGLSPATRQALASRLIDLGFAGASDRLVEGDESPAGLRLRARVALLRGEPEVVETLLAGDSSEEASAIRATAANHLGTHAEAAAILNASGLLDAAARASVLQGDWRGLEGLRDRGASVPALPQTAGSYLGRPPGTTEVASMGLQVTSLPSPGNPPPTTASGQAAPVQTPTIGLASTASEDTLQSPTTNDSQAVFDTLGLVGRAGVLVAESQRLRDAISAALDANGAP